MSTKSEYQKGTKKLFLSLNFRILQHLVQPKTIQVKIAKRRQWSRAFKGIAGRKFLEESL